MTIAKENIIPFEEFDFRDCFRVGDVLHGFCNGKFGRDNYATKEIVAVEKYYFVAKHEYSPLIDYPVYVMLGVHEIVNEDGDIDELFGNSFYKIAEWWKQWEE
jgi:hypothetical protein